jgi:hypothetical protein
MPRRIARGPVRQIILRVPEMIYAELITLVPDIVGSDGTTRYGATQQYFTSLMHQDLERRRALLRAPATPVPEVPYG